MTSKLRLLIVNCDYVACLVDERKYYVLFSFTAKEMRCGSIDRREKTELMMHIINNHSLLSSVDRIISSSIKTLDKNYPYLKLYLVSNGS